MATNEEFKLGDIPEREQIKAKCSCGAECLCVLRTFSNGTKHAWGTCPTCGKVGAKAQEGPRSLNDLSKRLGWIRIMVLSIPRGVEQDEALCMIERLCVDLESEMSR